MKSKPNPVKTNKNFIKAGVILIVLVLFLSIILLLGSSLSEKRSSLENVGYLFDRSHRNFTLESPQEGIYNLGEYQVNISSDKLLVLNLSIKCAQDSFHTLLSNKVVIQNAVIDAFSIYGGIHFPNTTSGKENIKKKITQNIYESLGYPLVEEVYFNKFIIQ